MHGGERRAGQKDEKEIDRAVSAAISSTAFR
jgi:hypothetical protein